MTKAPVDLQDLRRRIYVKAKAEPSWRFWGLYVHVCKRETLSEAYALAKENDGAPGSDGVSFEAIEESGVEAFLEQIQSELLQRSYYPRPARHVEIPKDGGTKVRGLSIPCIRDRVVQGALKLILEPIFEADFQPGSYGYRPKRTAQAAVARVAQAIVENKTRVIDLDLRAYFDSVRQDLLLAKVAQRVSDEDVLHLLKIILKASGKLGVPQGGVISPLLSNLYLNHHPRHNGLLGAVVKRLREEFAKLHVEINEQKSRIVDLRRGDSFGYLGFEFRRVRTYKGAWRPHYAPKLKKRTALLQKLKEVFGRSVSQPVGRVIAEINPILRGWVNYFAAGHSSRCFSYVKMWVEKKVRRHLERARKRRGFGWNRWSSLWIYQTLGLFNGYRLRRPTAKALPA
jgi:RNA-directed DNA polymerase